MALKTAPKTVNPPGDATDLYDALTLELDHASALAEHLADRLFDLQESGDREFYALYLIAKDIRARHELVVGKADALLLATEEGKAMEARRRNRGLLEVGALAQSGGVQ